MTVLVGYTASPEGEAAFAAGVEEAARRGKPLLVLNSARQGSSVDGHLANDDQVRALEERATAANVEMRIERTPHTDDLAHVLLETAHQANADVIVIGLRRRTAVGKLLMGSTAQRILIETDIPVLAVKAKAHSRHG